MKKHSLTRQITSIVSLLVAGAILLCWVLNTTLLPRYYMHNKKEVLIENYQTISNASAQNELNRTSLPLPLIICAPMEILWH